MAVQIDQSRDALFDELGLMRLRESYMRADEKSPQERFKFVAETFGSNPEHAARIYEYASRHWLSFATPILAFGRTGRGLPVSCYLSDMDDSAEGLIETHSEVNRLSMLGGGVGIHVGIRSADEKSVGVMPHLKVYDASCLAYRQGSTRRGSYAAFLSIDHPDIIPFIEMRKPTGDQNLKALNLHHGVNITDAFMEKIEASMRDADADDSWDLRHPTTGEVVATVSARDLWQRLLEMRMHTGEPYLVFTDTANRALPSWLKDKGLSIHGSNLHRDFPADLEGPHGRLLPLLRQPRVLRRVARQRAVHRRRDGVSRQRAPVLHRARARRHPPRALCGDQPQGQR